MFSPMACVALRWIKPIVSPTSSKYSRGLTRTRAPVGQFSSHEYAAVFAPGGFSPVPLHRLHLIASRFSVWVTGAGIRASPREKTEKSLENAPLPLPLDAPPSR